MANNQADIEVEVIYAFPDRIWRRRVRVGPEATVETAVQASGVRDVFPELASTTPPVGIFGRVCAYTERLRNGDRVEIYRPLIFDPMESRRRRARHRERLAAKKSA